MVRTFLLNDEQRKAIENYFEEWPDVMPPRLRQVRYKARQIDFEKMDADLALLKKIADITVPMGRKSENLKAKLVVRRAAEANLRAKFKVGERPSQIERGSQVYEAT